MSRVSGTRGFLGDVDEVSMKVIGALEGKAIVPCRRRAPLPSGRNREKLASAALRSIENLSGDLQSQPFHRHRSTSIRHLHNGRRRRNPIRHSSRHCSSNNRCNKRRHHQFHQQSQLPPPQPTINHAPSVPPPSADLQDSLAYATAGALRASHEKYKANSTLSQHGSKWETRLAAAVRSSQERSGMGGSKHVHVVQRLLSWRCALADSRSTALKLGVSRPPSGTVRWAQAM